MTIAEKNDMLVMLMQVRATYQTITNSKVYREWIPDSLPTEGLIFDAFQNIEDKPVAETIVDYIDEKILEIIRSIEV